MKAMLAMVVATALSAGCYRVTYNNPNSQMNGQVHREKGHFFLYGLVGHKDIPVYAMCPQGVAQIRSKHSFVDMLLFGLTVGLYSPRTYVVRCGGAS